MLGIISLWCDTYYKMRGLQQEKASSALLVIIIRPQQINFMDVGFAASILPWLHFFYFAAPFVTRYDWAA